MSVLGDPESTAEMLAILGESARERQACVCQNPDGRGSELAVMK